MKEERGARGSEGGSGPSSYCSSPGRSLSIGLALLIWTSIVRCRRPLYSIWVTPRVPPRTLRPRTDRHEFPTGKRGRCGQPRRDGSVGFVLATKWEGKLKGGDACMYLVVFGHFFTFYCCIAGGAALSTAPGCRECLPRLVCVLTLPCQKRQCVSITFTTLRRCLCASSPRGGGTASRGGMCRRPRGVASVPRVASDV